MKVPYEQLRKVFRTSQRIIDRDFAALSSAVTDITTSPEDEQESRENVGTALDNMIARVEGLKRKVNSEVCAPNIMLTDSIIQAVRRSQ